MGPDSTHREFVYLLGSKLHGWYKIGSSRNPRMRRFTIARGLPFEVELLAVWETEGALWLEKEMHRCHQENRVRGEWFSLTDEQLTSLLNRQDYGGFKIVSLDISASFASTPVKKPGRQTYWQRSQRQIGKCRQCGKMKDPEREQLALCLQCSKKARTVARQHRRKKVEQALNSPQETTRKPPGHAG